MTELLDAEPEDPDQLIELVGVDPERALAIADAVVAQRRPRPTADEVRLVVAAQRAAALALRGLGRPAEGERRVRLGLKLAERSGLADAAADARMTLAFVLLELGRIRAALTATDLALAASTGRRAARIRSTRALVLQRAGRPREALAEYDAALKVLRRLGDRDWEARLLHNRALLLIEFGETRQAIADLERSREFSLSQGQLVDAADALHNIGVALDVAGDIPSALATFDQVEIEWAHVDRPQLWMARVDVYLSAGLLADATSNARSAVSWLDGRHWEGLEAQARYTLARCLLATPGESLVEAREQARAAHRMFVEQSRRESEALAEYLLLGCALREGPTRKDLDRAGPLAERLRECGCEAEAADLRSAAGLAALTDGDLTRARVLLGPLSVQDRARSMDVRTRAWFARALLSRVDGDVPAAHSALRHAWDVVESQRSLLGATELRAAAASHAASVVETGTRLALHEDSARDAFTWAERGRAALLRYRPVVAPDDPDLARALARLRWAARTEDEARLDGQPDRAASIARRRGEAEVVRLTRGSAGATRWASPVRASDVRSRLEERVFVEYLSVDGRLWAVCVGARTTLVELGEMAPIRAGLDTTLFGLRRLLTGFGDDRSHDRSWSAVQAAAYDLDTLMLAPLTDSIGDRDLVVCPSPALTAVPWSLLPSARGRRLSVAPSATIWCSARDREVAGRPRSSLAVAGPDLEGAVDEVVAIAGLSDACRALTGSEATVERVLKEATQASVLHLAAHGRLRTDNPLFSSLELADGPLTAYDFESLREVPSTVVLSACSSGAGRTTVAEETLGLAWTLLGAGSTSVIAPLLPVPDATTRDLMVQVHRRMASGMESASALSEAQRDADLSDPQAIGVAAAFIAFGV